MSRLENVNIIFSGGGTGGHLFPGIAVAEEFEKHKNNGEIVFVGTSRGVETSIVPREGFRLELVRAEGIAGGSFFKKIKALLKMFIAIFDSFEIIKKYRPDIIIGLGGYASFATVFAGFFFMIPLLIMEQNSFPGLANRILGRFAKAVCVTYQESMSFFPKRKTYLTGNPVRERILKGSRTSAIKIFGLEPVKFTVLVFGGSGGAQRINKAIVEALQYLLDYKNEIQFLHQTGESDYEFVRDAYRNFGFSGIATPFIFQMAEAYAVCDLVISRAGATTLAELTSVGKPAVLVPYPHAAGNHQERNARKMEQMQAAFLILDRDMKGRKIAEVIKHLYRDEDLRDRLRQNCRTLGQPYAAKKVFDIAVSIMAKEKTRDV